MVLYGSDVVSNPIGRSAHPSRAQIETLLAFLEGNPSLAKEFSKVPSARDATRKKWERLTMTLNSIGGSVKSWKQWTKGEQSTPQNVQFPSTQDTQIVDIPEASTTNILEATNINIPISLYSEANPVCVAGASYLSDRPSLVISVSVTRVTADVDILPPSAPQPQDLQHAPTTSRVQLASSPHAITTTNNSTP
ncbi:uncharacterized protein LOC116412938 isoform X2 [Galleria mellonella]|uniref:Uncharacterized protein LOC116412938 isoform X2 n=1 Tax=Galleria mellonella TaxID=7137 RepID=A0A6J3BX15_GALME|nr:uncharacterized protein LOC116412938 isoform X2 [Galleria mellonella]